jgi:hypothetical protein
MVAPSRQTFHIWILRLHDSLSRLAGGGTVEERTPLHMERWNVQHRVICVRSYYETFRRHSLACSVARPYCTRFFLVGIPEIPLFRRRIMDYSRTQTSHCGWSCDYWWGPTEARVRQLPDTLATMQCNGGHLPVVICRKLACNVWVILANSLLGHIYRRFRLFFLVSIYCLWPFEMCQSARRHSVCEGSLILNDTFCLKNTLFGFYPYVNSATVF